MCPADADPVKEILKQAVKDIDDESLDYATRQSIGTGVVVALEQLQAYNKALEHQCRVKNTVISVLMFAIVLILVL